MLIFYVYSYNNSIIIIIKIALHYPGIEPEAYAWKANILPLN